ncbi:hypothetical protein BURMUCF1_A0395 [Burkholderia multivorans ATCC BAA-247]|nr:hypothetical protein BURMUCF1_A0395 [Burkholderia multivorans ATCC BAA-247]
MRRASGACAVACRRCPESQSVCKGRNFTRRSAGSPGEARDVGRPANARDRSPSVSSRISNSYYVSARRSSDCPIPDADTAS